MSANPSGRFGAPETEPGPSGGHGEFMRIPFTSGIASPSRIERARSAGHSPGVPPGRVPWPTLAGPWVCDRAQKGAAVCQAPRIAAPRDGPGRS